MRKILFLTAIIVALATKGALAAITLTSVTKTTGYNANATIHDTVAVAKHWRYLTSTSPTFSTTYSTGWFSGSFTGSLTNGLTVVDSVLMYVKVEYYIDSLPTAHDTSNVVVIRRKPRLNIVSTPAVTTMHFSVGGDPGNGSANLTCTTYTTSALWGCTGCTSLGWLTRSDSGTSVVTTSETIPGTAPLTPYTQYWHVFIYTNDVGADTVIRAEWTLSPPTLATVSLVSETHTSSTANIEMATNFFGYATPRGTMYWKISGSPSWTDSLVYAGYSVMTGVQNHTYALTGLYGSVTYVFGFKAYGYFGPVSLVDSFTTSPAPPVYNLETIAGYYDSSSGYVVTHQLCANISTANYSHYTVDFCEGDTSNVIDWNSHAYVYGSGVTHEFFTPTVSGPHWIHVYGADNAGHHMDDGYYLVNVTLPVPPPPIAHITSSFNINYGDMPTVHYWSSGGDSWSLNGNTVTDSGHVTFDLPILSDTTLTYIVCNSAGCDTVMCTMHIIDIPNGVSNTVTEKNSLSIYPNPTTSEITISCLNWNGLTINLLDMLGKNIMQVPLTGEKTKVQLGNLPNGMYAVSSPEGNQKIYKH